MTTLTLSQGGFLMDQRAQAVDAADDMESRISIETRDLKDDRPGMVSHHGEAKPNSLQSVTDKAKKMWNTPHIRVGMVLGGVAAAGALYFLFPSTSVQQQQIDGRDGVAAIQVDTAAGEVNAEQAEYLAAKQREEMAAKAQAGETNAAVLTTPTLIEDQQTGAISSNTSAQASTTPLSSSSTTGLRIGGEVVDGNSRFNRIELKEGVYYQDLNTNQYYKLSADGRALEPSLAPGVTGSSSGSTSDMPQNAMAAGEAPNSGGSAGDGGASGGAGGPPAEVAVPYNAEEDPDIQRYRSSFASNYDAYMMQNQNVQQANAAYQQQMAQNQQQMLQQRQALAQNGVATAINRVNALTTTSSTYAPRNYSISSQGGANGGAGGASSGISSQSGGFGTNAYGSGTGGNGGLGFNGGVTGQAGEVATNMMNDPMYYNRQATQGIINREDPGQFSDNSSISATGSVTGAGAGNQRLGGTAVLPTHVVRAGTQYMVVVTKTVNSDYGNVVEARVVGGPFAGSTVYGQLAPQGRNAGVVFSGLQKPNSRSPIIPLSARATTVDGRNGVADVKRHYMQNYTHMALTSALQGYGDAYANTGIETTISRSDGTVITTSDGENTRREVEANIAREFAAKLQQDTAHLGNRPPTFVIPAGTVLTMRFSQDWDTTQVSNSIPQ